MGSPSIEAWRELYDAAARFKELECWNWVSDADLFAVQDPASGEMGYCCVMGAMGEIYALAVYLGPDGLDSYMNLSRARSKSDVMEAALSQVCLMAGFGERRALAKEDLEVIKSLGLKFRGRDSWPIFRSYLPGYVPWHLTAGEAEFLALCLRQTIEVAGMVRENPGLMLSHGDTRMLARVPEKEGVSWQWKDVWITPALPDERATTTLVPDQATKKRMLATIPRKQMTWEIGVHYAPMSVAENRGDRPYYPLILMCVDRDSGFIFGTDVMAPADKPNIAATFLNFLARAGVMPARLAIANDDLLELLEPAASALGIQVLQEKRLKSLAQAQRSLEKGLMRGGF